MDKDVFDGVLRLSSMLYNSMESGGHASLQYAKAKYWNTYFIKSAHGTLKVHIKEITY
jgi:hypothetical protein